MPNETLCEIFQLLCNEPITLHVLQNASKFNKFPWAVGLVCKRWRAVFLSHSRLWTSFYLQECTLNVRYIAEMDRRTALYLERSGHLPLTIIVHQHDIAKNTNLPSSTWKILWSFANHWKTAELILTYPGCIVNNLRRCTREMQSLESLEIQYPDVASFDVFKNAPHLVEVNLIRPRAINIESFPLNQIRRFLMLLEANRDQIQNLYSNLREFSNIEELRLLISYLYVVTIEVPQYPSVHLPRLRLLQVSHPSFLSWIDAPVLKYLHAEDCYNEFSRCHQGFLPFIQPSCRHIRQLTLERCFPRTLFSFMKVFTHLDNLSFFGAPVRVVCSIIEAVAKFEFWPPDLRVLEVACLTEISTSSLLVKAIFSLLEIWNGGSRVRTPLEKLVVQMNWNHQEGASSLGAMKEASWPSFVAVQMVHPEPCLDSPQCTIFDFSPIGLSSLAYPPPGIKRLLDSRSTTRHRVCKDCINTSISQLPRHI